MELNDSSANEVLSGVYFTWLTYMQRYCVKLLKFPSLFFNRRNNKWRRRHINVNSEYYLVLKPEARWPFDERLLDVIKIHYVKTRRNSVNLRQKMLKTCIEIVANGIELLFGL